MVGKDKWFQVEGIVVGWLRTQLDEPDPGELLEMDVAVVQTDEYKCYIRWLGNDWDQIDPPPRKLEPIKLPDGTISEGVEQYAVVGTRIRFMTCRREQKDYVRLALGKDARP